MVMFAHFFRGCFETPVAELRCCHQSQEGSTLAGEAREGLNPTLPSQAFLRMGLWQHCSLILSSGLCTVGPEGLSG